MPDRSPKRRFDPHQFIVQAKVWAVEIAGAVLFFTWLFRTVAHELGWR